MASLQLRRLNVVDLFPTFSLAAPYNIDDLRGLHDAVAFRGHGSNFGSGSSLASTGRPISYSVFGPFGCVMTHVIVCGCVI